MVYTESTRNPNLLLHKHIFWKLRFFFNSNWYKDSTYLSLSSTSCKRIPSTLAVYLQNTQHWGEKWEKVQRNTLLSCVCSARLPQAGVCCSTSRVWFFFWMHVLSERNKMLNCTLGSDKWWWIRRGFGVCAAFLLPFSPCHSVLYIRAAGLLSSLQKHIPHNRWGHDLSRSEYRKCEVLINKKEL